MRIYCLISLEVHKLNILLSYFYRLVVQILRVGGRCLTEVLFQYPFNTLTRTHTVADLRFSYVKVGHCVAVLFFVNVNIHYYSRLALRFHPFMQRNVSFFQTTLLNLNIGLHRKSVNESIR